jgi:uncharacterized protein with HEPN domain
MHAEDRKRLTDMARYAREAIEFLAGADRAAFENDRKTQAAVIRNVEVIGEAAAKVSPETRTRLPDVPWPAIVGMRNVLIHGYSDIKTWRVHEVVTNLLPELIASLERILGEHDT